MEREVIQAMRRNDALLLDALRRAVEAGEVMFGVTSMSSTGMVIQFTKSRTTSRDLWASLCDSYILKNRGD